MAGLEVVDGEVAGGVSEEEVGVVGEDGGYGGREGGGGRTRWIVSGWMLWK